MSSKTSVRSTTAPGETARLPPTSNWLVSTLSGKRRAEASRTKRRAPVARLAPPRSMVSRITAGFDHGKFVGARASRTFALAKRAWRSLRQSRSASVIRPSTASTVAR